MFVSVTVPEIEAVPPDGFIGVDFNTTGHAAVVGNPKTGKVFKLGKKNHHTHKKYSNTRRSMQKNGKYKKAKSIKNRENKIVRGTNHKISNEIVKIAKESNNGIKLENLEGIRKRAKVAKSFKYSLNSWPFYQLGKMIEYKAKLHGVVVIYVDPQYTSKSCSRCGLIGNRNNKRFKCPHCGHVDHADANAAFNIALRHECIDRLYVDRDACNGSTALIPQRGNV